MTYHLDWTVFLFAHTIAEVLDLPRSYSCSRRPSTPASPAGARESSR